MTSDRSARKFPLALGRLGGASVTTAKMTAARGAAGPALIRPQRHVAAAHGKPVVQTYILTKAIERLGIIRGIVAESVECCFRVLVSQCFCKCIRIDVRAPVNFITCHAVSQRAR